MITRFRQHSLILLMPLFSQKKLLIFQNKNFLSQERKTIVFIYAFMFSSLILASFTVHKGLTLEKVYSVQLRFFLTVGLKSGYIHGINV